MSLATLRTHMICWDANSDRVALVEHPDTDGRSDRLRFSTGACWGYVERMTKHQRMTLVLVESMRMIVDYEVDPQAVHRALLGLSEYREAMSFDHLDPRPPICGREP